MKNSIKKFLGMFLVASVLLWSCSYDKDIADINDRLDQLENGRVAGLEEQLTALQTSLNSLKDLQTTMQTTIDGLKSELETLKGDVAANKEKIDAVNSAIADLEKGLEDVKTQISNLEKDVNTKIEDINKKFEDYATKEWASSTFATLESVKTLEANLGTLEGTVGAIDERLTAVEGLYDSDQKLSDIVKGLNDSINKAQNDASAAMGAVEDLKNALGVYAEDGKLESTFKAYDERLADLKEELDSKVGTEEYNKFKKEYDEFVKKYAEFQKGYDAFKAEFDKFVDNFDVAVEEAITNSGYLTKKFDEVNKNIDAINATLTALTGKVEDLANRVQSLVFVPEYNDNKATVLDYRLAGGMDEGYVAEHHSVFATFQVTPKEYAANIAAQPENVSLYVVPVKTRAAADAKVITGENLKISADAKTGRIEVEGLVEGHDHNYAIALYIADSKAIKDAEANQDIASIESGSFVSSEYVQVEYDTKASVLNNAYRLYNAEEKREFTEADKTIFAQWSNAPYHKEFFEGFSYYMFLNETYMTLEEAAEYLSVDVKEITPVYTAGKPVLVPQNAIIKVGDAAFGKFAEMTKAKPEEARDHVGEYVTVEHTFTVNDVEVLEDVDASKYIITNKQYSIVLKDKNVDWTYQFAYEHAYRASNGWQENYEPIVLDEVGVASPSMDELLEIDFDKILNCTNYTTTVTRNGVDVPNMNWNRDLVIEFVAKEEARIAKVQFSNYEFSQKEAGEYVIERVYTLDEYDVKVSFNLTLGKKPADVVVDLGTIEQEVLATNVEINMPELLKKAFDLTENSANVFKPEEGVVSTSYREFNAAFKAGRGYWNQPKYSAVRYDNAEGLNKTDLYDNETRLFVDTDPNSYVSISKDNVKKASNVFEFETVESTWFGVKYTFKAKVQMVAPEYTLVYHQHLVKEGMAQVVGTVENGKYAINDINLDKYFMVNYKGSTTLPKATDLNVKFEITTKANAYQGILNVPASPVAPSTVDQTGVITSNTIVWGNFTARELAVKATLFINGIEIDAKNLTIVTPAPVSNFKSSELKGEHTPGQEVTVKLWEGLSAEGVLEEGKNIFNPKAASFSDVFATYTEGYLLKHYNEVYGLGLTIDKVVSVTVGGSAVTNVNYNLNAAEGLLTYKAENAQYNQPVVITVQATMTYYLDYNHKQQYVINIPVQFVEK